MRSWKSSSRSSAILIAFVTACAGALPALAACPTSTFDFGGVLVEESAATAESSYNSRSLSYDLPNGRLFEHHNGGLVATTVHARDAYDLVGVPPGSLVPFSVQLHVDGIIWTDGCGGSGCWGGIFGAITYGASVQQHTADANIYGADTVAVSFDVTLPVTFTAGQPNVLELALGGYRPPGGGHLSEGTGTWRFAGLPAGVFVTSCQGYLDPATPVRPSSWGRLKARYR